MTQAAVPSPVSSFMQTIGVEVLKQGYEVIEIAPGLKRPKRDEWASHPLTLKGVQHYSKPGFGVGILAAYTPGLDIDVNDESQVKQILDLIQPLIGVDYPRVGRYPRVLYPYRTNTPFKKRKLVWLDEQDVRQTVEWLGNGQQWVAYHIHPDTKKAYQWMRGPLPEREKLIEINESETDLILDLIQHWAELQGYEIVRSGVKSKKTGPAKENIEAPLQGWTEDQIKDLLRWIPVGEYETWIEVGMGLWHQSQGKSWGFDLWIEYTSRSDEYDPDTLDTLKIKWDSYLSDDTDVITLRSIIKWSEEGKRSIQAEEKQELLSRTETCIDIEELRGDLRTDIVLSGIDDPIWFQTLCQAWLLKFKELTGTRIGVKDVRKELQIGSGSALNLPSEMPNWMDDWHYVIETETFVCAGTRNHMSRTGFSDRYMQQASKLGGTTGAGRPTIAAADLALNSYAIPKVDAERYRPGFSAIYNHEGGTYLNTYDPDSVPELNRDNYEAVAIAIDVYFEMMFKISEEREWVQKWCANLIQYPEQRNQTTILLRGPQGVGKNTLGKIIEVAIGSVNASTLTPETLAYQFTDWAHGYQLVTIEEVKLHGVDRHQVVNRLRTYITGDIVEIHPKGRTSFKTINTTNYLLLTNYRDALPVPKEDRRIFACETRFKHERHVHIFLKKDPDYFIHLYNIIDKYPGEIREYFMNVEMEGFRSTDRAPMTNVRRQMSEATKSPLTTAVEDLIEDRVHPLIQWEFISMNILQMALEAPDHTYQGKVNDRLLQHTLSFMGFRVLGRYRLTGVDGTDPGSRHRIWLRCGELGDEELKDNEIIRSIKRLLYDQQSMIG